MPISKVWIKLEHEIQQRGKKKDKGFRLSGSWKRFIRIQEGYKIYLVDGKWVRNNLCAYFSHGGHGLVHEFIPMDEIWIDSHHYDDGITDISKCGCRVRKRNSKISKNYFESTLVHELTEAAHMKKGMPYRAAHKLALKAEVKLGLLKDPFDDT